MTRDKFAAASGVGSEFGGLDTCPTSKRDSIPQLRSLESSDAPIFSDIEYDETDLDVPNSFWDHFLDRLTRPKTIETGICILGWYFFSLSISVYNKWMFGAGLGFKFPILITAFHQMCILLMSGLILYMVPRWRPPSMAMSWGNYFRQIMPCSFASAGDIGLSNFLFQFITLSLYTMVKTSSLVFVLLFGLLFKLERFNWRLVVIVGIMTASVMMMVSSPSSSSDTAPDATRLGVMLVLAASFVSGIRWSFTQILLKRNTHTSNPICTLFYISPAMSLALVMFGLAFEGWNNFTLAPIWAERGVAQTIGLMILPSMLAFMNTLCEFRLLSVLQVVTLLVAGIFKELLTIVVSTIVFGDRLSAVNVIGVVLTFADILWYNLFRLRQTSSTESEELKDQQSHEYEPVVSQRS